MKKLSLFFITVILIIFASCKKENNNNSYSVTYKVTETIPGSSPFMIKYTLANGTLKTEGPIATGAWISENINGYKKGSIVSLYLDSPGGSYDMAIYINGSLQSQAPADGGSTEQVLEAQIPN